MTIKFGELPENNISIMGAQSYVISRNLLGNNELWNGVFFMFSCLFLMHHSIECYVKAILDKNSIKRLYQREGHDLGKLLNQFSGNQGLIDIINSINSDKNILQLINELSSNYTKNKYFENSISSDKGKLIDTFDKLIYLLHNKLYEGIDERKKAIDVPTNMIEFVEFGNKQPFIWCVGVTQNIELKNTSNP